MKIPLDSIIFTAQTELDKLRAQTTTPKEIQELTVKYKGALAEIVATLKILSQKKHLNKNSPEIRVKKLEQQVYMCLLFFCQFRALQKSQAESPKLLDSNNLTKYLHALTKYERDLHNAGKNATEKRVVRLKLKLFLLSINVNVLILAQMPREKIMGGILHFICEHEKYNNLNETLRFNLSEQKNPELVADIIQASNASACWSMALLDMIQHFAVFSQKLGNLSYADQEFIAHYSLSVMQNTMRQTCLALPNTPLLEAPPSMISPMSFEQKAKLLDFDFAGFKKRLRHRTALALLSEETEPDPQLIEGMLSVGKLLFLKLQLVGILYKDGKENSKGNSSEEILALFAKVQNQLNAVLPWIFIYHRFSTQPYCSFLGMATPELDISLLGDSDSSPEMSLATVFFNALHIDCQITDSIKKNNTLTKFFGITAMATNPKITANIKKFQCYFLLDAADDYARAQLFNVLATIKADKNPYLGLDTLAILFKPNKKKTAENSAEKIQAIQDYLKLISPVLGQQRNHFRFMAIFYLICKIALELKNPQLSLAVKNALSELSSPDQEKLLPPMTIPAESIVRRSSDELYTIMTAQDTDLIRLEANFGTALCALDADLEQSPKETAETTLKELEHSVLLCLNLYVAYRSLIINPEVKTNDFNRWLIQRLDIIEHSIRLNHYTYTEEKLTFHKLKVFLLALKMHVLILSKANSTSILSAFLHFAGEMQNYKNAAEYEAMILRKSGRDPLKNAYVMHAITLFSGAQIGSFESAWSLCTMTAVSATLSHITQTHKKDFSPADQKFAVYVQQCLTYNSSPFDASMIPELEPDFIAGFGKEITTRFLGKKHTGVSFEKRGLLLGKHLFLQLYLVGIFQRDEEPRFDDTLLTTYQSLQKMLQEHRPALFLYRYFLDHKPVLRFLDIMDASGKPDLGDPELVHCLHFFEELTGPDPQLELCHDLACAPRSKHTQQLLLYYLMDTVKDNKLCANLLKKFTLDKNDSPLIIASLNTLHALFNAELTTDKKVTAVVNFLKTLGEHQSSTTSSLSIAAAFFLICKKGFEFNNPALSDMLSGAMGLSTQKPKAVESKLQSIDETMRFIEGDAKPKPVKNKKSTAKKNHHKKKTASKKTEAVVEKPPVEETVIQEEIPKAPAATITEKTQATQSIKNKKKKKNKKTERPIPVVTERIAPWRTPKEERELILAEETESQPAIASLLPNNTDKPTAPPLDILDNVAQDLHSHLAEEKCSEASFLLNSPLVENLLETLNAKANAANQFKYATALFGGATLALYLKKDPREIKDWDMMIRDCSLEETKAFLDAHMIELGIASAKIVGVGHRNLLVRFKDSPIIVEISCMKAKASPDESLMDQCRATQAELDFTVNSLFLFHTREKSAGFLVDTQQACKSLNTTPPVLKRIAHKHADENIGAVILRGLKHLVKHPEFVIDPETAQWIKENAHHTAHKVAFNPFIKLLYSGFAHKILPLAKEYGVLDAMFPVSDENPETLATLVNNPRFMEYANVFDEQHSAQAREDSAQRYPQVAEYVLNYFSHPPEFILKPEKTAATSQAALFRKPVQALVGEAFKPRFSISFSQSTPTPGFYKSE